MQQESTENVNRSEKFSFQALLFSQPPECKSIFSIENILIVPVLLAFWSVRYVENFVGKFLFDDFLQGK